MARRGWPPRRGRRAHAGERVVEQRGVVAERAGKAVARRLAPLVEQRVQRLERRAAPTARLPDRRRTAASAARCAASHWRSGADGAEAREAAPSAAAQIARERFAGRALRLRRSPGSRDGRGGLQRRFAPRRRRRRDRRGRRIGAARKTPSSSARAAASTIDARAAEPRRRMGEQRLDGERPEVARRLEDRAARARPPRVSPRVRPAESSTSTPQRASSAETRRAIDGSGVMRAAVLPGVSSTSRIAIASASASSFSLSATITATSCKRVGDRGGRKRRLAVAPGVGRIRPGAAPR